MGVRQEKSVKINFTLYLQNIHFSAVDGDNDDDDNNLALIAPSVRLSSSTDPQSPRLKISCSSAHGYHHCPHIIGTIMLKTPDAE